MDGSQRPRCKCDTYVSLLSTQLLKPMHQDKKCLAKYLWSYSCREKYKQPQICRWYHSNGRRWRGTKEPLDEGEGGEWKSWLKIQHSKNEDHGIWFHHFMTNRRGKSGSSDRIYFLSSKIIEDSDCSHEIKRHFLLVRKALTKLDSILKNKDITLLTNVHIVKAMVFPVVMYRCQSWTIKKSECWRIDAFELWCWRKLLGVPCTAGDQTSQS